MSLYTVRIFALGTELSFYILYCSVVMSWHGFILRSQILVAIFKIYGQSVLWCGAVRHGTVARTYAMISSTILLHRT